ncbi:MAG TPA: glycosyltransferase family 39 protein [Gemmataceae bacterium]|nr:glycosyltransferase family 39 protein [Gemmataceae bacterium]
MERATPKKLEARTPATEAVADSRRVPSATWIMLGLIVLVVAGLRLRLQETPLERDEGEYAYVGQLILRGELPYQRAYTMKFPGTHYAYALILAIFGQTDVGIHQGLLVVNAASIVLIFLLASRLFDPSAGLSAAAAFGVLSLSNSMLGFTANTEHFVVLPMLGGTLLLVRGVEECQRVLFLGAGVLLGLAVLMKQHAAVFVAFGAVFLVVRGGLAWRQTLLRGLLFALGVALPIGVLFLYLWAKGAFAPFWFWTVIYAQHYTSMATFDQGIKSLAFQAAQISGSSVSLWALAALGAFTAFWVKGRRDRVLFLFLFTTFSFLAVCPGLLFREHYFLLFVPAASLLAGAGAAFVGRFRFSSLSASQATACVTIAAIAVALLQQRAYFFGDSPQVMARKIYWNNPFEETKEIAQYVRANSDPDDRIAVLGSEPQIYFYADRQSATPFLYVYPLTEPQPYALEMQKDMIAQIEREEPRFLVAVNVSASWIRLPNSSPLFKWINQYVPAHYRCVGVADKISETFTAYRWGDEAARYQPFSQIRVLLFERTASR